jgi:hypothetical protein
MVFIERTRHQDANSSPCYNLRSVSRAQKTAVVAVIAIDEDQLGQLAVERSAVSQEPDLVSVVGVDSQDHRARLAVTLEEAAAAIVDNDVAKGWRLHVVERAEAVDGGTGAPGAWHRSVATESG